MDKITDRKIDNYIHLPLMTVSETAKYMGIGRKMVYMLIELGEIRVVKSRRAVLVEKSSVDIFMQSGKRI